MIVEFKDVLTNEECERYINEIENSTHTRPFTTSSNFKNIKYIDEQLANYFYDKVKIGKRANKYIMCAKYTSGQNFNIHTDTGIYFNKKYKEYSKYTLLIYLNDNFDGGETIFYDDSLKEIKRIKPKKGSAIVFDMDIFHKGNLVTGCKYWIGCELIDSL